MSLTYVAHFSFSLGSFMTEDTQVLYVVGPVSGTLQWSCCLGIGNMCFCESLAIDPFSCWGCVGKLKSFFFFFFFFKVQIKSSVSHVTAWSTLNLPSEATMYSTAVDSCVSNFERFQDWVSPNVVLRALHREWGKYGNSVTLRHSKIKQDEERETRLMRANHRGERGSARWIFPLNTPQLLSGYIWLLTSHKEWSQSAKVSKQPLTYIEDNEVIYNEDWVSYHYSRSQLLYTKISL